MIPYGKQEITQEDIDAVVATLQSDFLTQGPKIREFEDAFAQKIGAKYAVAVANGTAALHLCALALGVDEKTRVITSPITFAASSNCILYCGGSVDFADVDPETILLDLNKVEDLIKSKPEGYYQGVTPVSFAGLPVPMHEFRTLAEKYGLWIIEDACHAPGGSFQDGAGKKIYSGSCQYSNLAIFSFHPVKHIATGEGGMVTTNDEELYKKLLLFRTHGITKDPDVMEHNHGGWYYEMQELGYNYRLSDIHAALGLSQLSRLEVNVEHRNRLARRYDEAFRTMPVTTIPVRPGSTNAYHLYVIQTEHRKALYDFLRTKNIFAQVHYIPVHLLPYYKRLGWKKGDLPVAEAYYDRCLSLPMYHSMTDAQQDQVVNAIKEFFER